MKEISIMIQIAGAIVRNQKAYLCVKAETEAGFYIDVEPVFIADLNVDDFTSSLEKVIALGHPKISTPTPSEMKQRKDPILTATKTKNWKALAKNSVSYSLSWTQDGIVLYISRLDKKGRFEIDPNKTTIFPKETELRTIVETILVDIQSRPELDTK